MRSWLKSAAGLSSDMETRLNRFLRTRPLAAVCAAIVLGAIAGVTAREISFYLICGGGFALIAGVLCALKKPNRFAAWLCVVIFASAAYGAWRVYREAFPGIRHADVSGIVAEDPTWQAERKRTVFRLTDVTVDGKEVGYDVRVYAYGEPTEPITMADAVSFADKLHEPARTGNVGFDFQQYLWAENVGQFASLYVGQLAIEPQDGGLMERLAGLRAELRARVDELFPENASLLKGLMLGDRTDIAAEDEAAFSDSGIMHLLAVSGLHVSIIASALTMLGIALCIPRPVMLAGMLMLLSAYAVLCGGSPSVIRAVVMYLLLQGGGITRRYSDSFTRLCVACAAMVLYEPRYLWQVGFQLSFAAVAGLTMLLPTIQQMRCRLYPKSDVGGKIMDMMLVSIAVQLTSLPIMIAAFGSVSWVSLILNIAAIPLAQAALMAGLAALLLSFLMPVSVLAMAVDGLTGWLISLAHWGASLPFSVVNIPALTLPFVFLYIICVLAGSAQFKTKLWARMTAICLLPVLVAANAAVGMLRIANEDFSITFLDVGQADAAIVNADGTLYMVDVGQNENAAAYIAQNHLDIKGIFLSHAHDDHVGGLTEVLAVCDPEWICLPEGFFGGEAEIASLTAIAQAEEDAVEIRTMSAGDSVALSEAITAYVLYPETGMVLDGGNDTSMLLQMVYGDGSVLFTGDLTMNAEPMVLPECSVLKVAHHGSRNSTSSRMLAAVRPSLAVISVGKNNTYGHPTEEVLARLEALGCRVLRTDEVGTITVYIDRAGNVWTETAIPVP